MDGTYLIELYDEVKQLLPDINLALTAQDLSELTEINDKFIKTNLAKRPFMLVDLSEPKNGREPYHEGISVIEEVILKLQVYVAGNQRDALAYEGLIKSFFKDQEANLRNKIQDAYLGNILPLYSSLKVDEEFKNNNGWIIELRFRLLFNWE